METNLKLENIISYIKSLNGKRVKLLFKQYSGNISTTIGILSLGDTKYTKGWCFISEELYQITEFNEFCGAFQLLLPNLKRIVKLELV